MQTTQWEIIGAISIFPTSVDCHYSVLELNIHLDAFS